MVLASGDEGKGLVTDWLCSEPNIKDIVVRFSGGQQAGHTVFHRGVKHIFSNFGAGTLKGVPSYFTEDTSIFINNIVREYNVLKAKGINPKLYVHPLTKVTTHYDVAFNRCTEKLLGHGSCGLGIAATQKRSLETPYKLFAVDYLHPDVFIQKLNAIKEYYYSIIESHGISTAEFIPEYLNHMPEFMNLIFNYSDYFTIKDYNFLKDYEKLIFEGSQGILLDKDHGIFPNVTYSSTTPKNAIKLSEELGFSPEIYYVSRCYFTRHGNGWIPNLEEIQLINNSEEINVFNVWQNNFKVREIDYSLLNYALSIGNIYCKDYPINLVVTCLDQRPDFKFDLTQLNHSFKNTFGSYGVSDNIKQL